jgi:hypothetical protein
VLPAKGMPGAVVESVTQNCFMGLCLGGKNRRGTYRGSQTPRHQNAWAVFVR